MNNEATVKKPSQLISICKTKCPRCRQGDMFANSNPYHLSQTMKMNETCSECGQAFDLEVGFYYGTSYVSYALAVAVSAATIVIWWMTIGLSVNDNRLLYWMIVNGIILIGLQPIFMRWARTIWLSFFVHYDPDWAIVPPEAPERVNEEMKHGW